MADGFITAEVFNAAMVADMSIVNDIGTVAQAQRNVLVLFGQQHRKATGLELQNLLFEHLDDDRCQSLRGFIKQQQVGICLLYTSPSPRDRTRSRMPSSA